MWTVTLKHILILKHCWLGWLDCARAHPEPPSSEDCPLSFDASEDILDENDDEGI